MRIKIIALAAGFCFVNAVQAEDLISKLGTAPQVIVDRPAATVPGMTKSILPSTVSVDLKGGKLDKFSYAVKYSSATGAGTLTLTTSISPDDGTNWIVKDTQTIAPNLTGGASVYQNIDMNPGTKVRVVPSLTTGCTFYDFKAWAMPRVD